MEPTLQNQQFVLVWIFGWAIFYLALRYLRNRREQHRMDLIHKERLAAMERGVPLPEMPEYDSAPRRSMAEDLRAYSGTNPRWSLGLGAISIMLGAGTSVALWLSGEQYHNRIWSFGLIGVFLGFGLFLHYALTRGGRRTG